MTTEQKRDYFRKGVELKQKAIENYASGFASFCNVAQTIFENWVKSAKGAQKAIAQRLFTKYTIEREEAYEAYRMPTIATKYGFISQCEADSMEMATYYAHERF